MTALLRMLEVVGRSRATDDPVLAVIILRDDPNYRVEPPGGLLGMDPGLFSRTMPVPFQGVNLRTVSRGEFIALRPKSCNKSS